MIDFTKLRCYRDFKPLRIVNITNSGLSADRYKIILGKRQKVGTFCFSNKGFVSSLNIKRKFRKKKTGVNALISIYEFIMQKAKELNIDCLWFVGLESNKNNVVKLYKRVASVFPELDGHSTFMLPVNKKGQEIFDSFSKPIGLPQQTEIDEFISLAAKKLKYGQIQ